MIAAADVSPRQSLIAVIVFFGLLVGTVLWGAIFLLVNQGLREKFDAKTQIFEQLRRRPTLALGGNVARLNDQAATIAAVSETLAASELQKAVLASLDTAGGSVRSIQADSSKNVAEDGLRILSAQLTFDSSLGALQEFLFAIETAMPYIFVDSMIIQPSNPSAGADRLRVTLAASSYWKPPARPTATE